MTQSLKYPHDRVNGFVQLKDGDGKLFVPEFNRFSQDSNEGDAMKYAGAFLILAKRLDEQNRTRE